MNSIKRLFSSAFLQIAICLLIFDLVSALVIPNVVPEWYYTNFPGVSYSKVISYLTTPQDPPILLLGSSLACVPSVACDIRSFHGPASVLQMPKRDVLARTATAYTFQRMLAAKTGKQLDVLNLSMPACMASDYTLILKKAFEQGKRPQLIICCTAPAEFLSNDQPYIQGTAVYLGLSKFSGEHLTLKNLPAKVQAMFSEHVDFIKLLLANLRREGTDWLCDRSNRSPDIASAKAFQERRQKAVANREQQIHDLTVGRKNNLPDLALFKERYNPPNLELFEKHMDNFQAMMRSCREQGVSLLVVNMPMTDANKRLLAAPAYQQYKTALARNTRRFGAVLLDLDRESAGYQLSDFYDSTHLNEIGGQKFLSSLSDTVSTCVNASGLARAGSQN